jgi:hypothetical protein
MMTDTFEVKLSLSSIWDFLRTQVIDRDVGPYPTEKIIIGTGISKRKPGNIVEISRLDALAACMAWQSFSKGDRRALQDPRLSHVIETLAYLMGLQAGLAFKEAIQFGAWLAYTITGWNDGQNDNSMRRLEHIAKQAAFRPAVKAVLVALSKGITRQANKKMVAV